MNTITCTKSADYKKEKPNANSLKYYQEITFCMAAIQAIPCFLLAPSSTVIFNTSTSVLPGPLIL